METRFLGRGRYDAVRCKADHPDETFVTYVGLARGYTAVADTRNAIANWEIAIKNIPENQKVNLPVYEQALKALKEQS